MKHTKRFTPGTGARVAHSVTYVGYDVVFAGVHSGFVRWPTVALRSNFLEPIILYFPCYRRSRDTLAYVPLQPRKRIATTARVTLCYEKTLITTAARVTPDTRTASESPAFISLATGTRVTL